MISFDLGGYSDKVRREYLVPSSGWIGDIIIPLSNLTGIWDIFLLSALFIISWTTIRLSDRVVALILARVFDTTIPLQYQLNPNAQGLHAAHCERYWPVWYVATAVEAGAYFLLHPDLFTLVTCFKTTAMVVYWHDRRADGSFWTAPAGSVVNVTTGAPRPVPKSDREAQQAEWSAKLKAKGYSSKARREMLKTLGKTPRERREGVMKTWVEADAQGLKDRNAKYEARAT